MKIQSYTSHIRYYPPHHFVFYPLVLAGLVYTLYKAFSSGTHTSEWLLMSFLLLLIGWLSYMMRQHYALTLQDRVVRLEMRLRYHLLTGQDFGNYEDQLSFGQIAALRFASDAELLSLLEKAVAEKMPPAVIKRSIQNWLPDHSRV